MARNTPTRVGKTEFHLRNLQEEQKHPHSRGEDLSKAHRSSFVIETPPLAWGRLRGVLFPQNKDGNTPTRVGKT